jgi:hypothetical protein
MIIATFLLLSIGYSICKAQTYKYKTTYLHVHIKNELISDNWLMDVTKREISGKLQISLTDYNKSKAKATFFNTYGRQMNEILFDLSDAKFDKVLKGYRIKGTDLLNKGLAIILIPKLDLKNLSSIGVIKNSKTGGLELWEYTVTQQSSN